jgi:hypothetical protein
MGVIIQFMNCLQQGTDTERATQLWIASKSHAERPEDAVVHTIRTNDSGVANVISSPRGSWAAGTQDVAEVRYASRTSKLVQIVTSAVQCPGPAWIDLGSLQAGAMLSLCATKSRDRF